MRDRARRKALSLGTGSEHPRQQLLRAVQHRGDLGVGGEQPGEDPQRQQQGRALLTGESDRPVEAQRMGQAQPALVESLAVEVDEDVGRALR